MGCTKDKFGREGGSPTQFLPYYLNGLVPLSYQVNDANLAELRDKYMASILGGQNATGSPPAGWLGPEVDSPLEYWPKYLAIEAIESYAEAVPAAESAKGRWHRPHLFFSFLLLLCSFFLPPSVKVNTVPTFAKPRVCTCSGLGARCAPPADVEGGVHQVARLQSEQVGCGNFDINLINLVYFWRIFQLTLAYMYTISRPATHSC